MFEQSKGVTMQYKEGLKEYRKAMITSSNEKRKHYFCVKTTNDGDIYLWAERQMVNESGAIMFMNSTSMDKFYPVVVIGPREYVLSYAADPSTKQPVAVESWG